jgi:hypothetical protein
MVCFAWFVLGCAVCSYLFGLFSSSHGYGNDAFPAFLSFTLAALFFFAAVLFGRDVLEKQTMLENRLISAGLAKRVPVTTKTEERFELIATSTVSAEKAASVTRRPIRLEE